MPDYNDYETGPKTALALVGQLVTICILSRHVTKQRGITW